MPTPRQLRSQAAQKRASANGEASAMEHQAAVDERKEKRDTIMHNLFGPRFTVFLISLALIIIFLTWFGK